MRVLLLGDSHSVGPYGQELEALLRSAGHEVTRIAWVGAAASHYLKGTEKQIGLGGTGDYASAKRQSYDLAVVSLGTNDAAGGAPKTAAANIQSLFGQLNAGRKVWVGPPAFSRSAASTYNPAFLKKDLNARSADLYEAMRSSGLETIDPRAATQPFVSTKDIHFNAPGGKAWARFVASELDTTARSSASPQVKAGSMGLLSMVLVAVAAWAWLRRVERVK